MSSAEDHATDDEDMPAPTMDQSVRADLALANKSQAAVREAEDLDDHVAEEHLKIVKATRTSGAGRPRKTRTQLLQDVGRVLRDKVTSINDLQDRLKIDYDEVIATTKAFKDNMPEDIASVKAALEKDFNHHIEKIKVICENTEKHKLEELCPEGSMTAAEEIRKQLVREVKPIYDTHVKAVTNSMKALKKAVRDASKGAKKNRKMTKTSSPRPRCRTC